MKKSVRMGMAVLALSLAAGTCFAQALPRPGLWSQTMSLDGVPGMTDGMNMEMMAEMATPEMQAQMQAMGIPMPNFNMTNNGVVVQVCITQEDIDNAQTINLGQEFEGCSVNNMQTVGNRLTGNIVCTGENAGSGDFEYIYDSDTHYTGTVNYTGMFEGVPISSSHATDATWVAADCGSVAP
jgi:hypothetical protein